MVGRSLWILFVVATGVRILFVWVQAQYSLFHVGAMSPDSYGYVGLAENLLKGAGLTFDGVHPTAGIAPGFPLYLAGLFLLGIKGPISIALVNALLGGATCVMVSCLGTRLGSRRIGILAGWTAAFYPQLIFWTPYVLTETLYIFGMMLSLLLLSLFIEHPTARWSSLAGLALGCTVMVRPVGLSFLFFVMLWLLWRFRASFRRVCAVPLLAFVSVIPLGAWVIRNAVTMGAPIATTTDAGGGVLHGKQSGCHRGQPGLL